MSHSPSSEQIIQHAVRAVWGRVQVLRAMRGVWVGLLAAAVVYLPWALLGEPRPGWLMAIGCVGGALGAIGFREPRQTHAHRIDEALGLKDRVVSAAEFSQRADPSEIYLLQIRDAARRVDGFSPSQVAPWRWHRDLGVAALAGGLFLIGHWPHGAGDARAVVAPAPAALTREADVLAVQLDDLTEELAAAGDEDLQEVVASLREQAEQLAEPGGDLESGLQTLGRIRNELEEAIAAMDLATDLALLAALAEALQLAKPTQAAARALADGNLAEAAEQLDQAADRAADETHPIPEDAQALAGPLEQLAQRAQEAGNQELGQVLEQTAESIRSADPKAFSDGLKRQAGVTRQTAVRRQLAQALQSQLRQLADARDRMTGDYCEACTTGLGPCVGEPGGACASQGMSLAETVDPTSTEASASAGMGSHDEPFGEATDLDSVRVEEQVSGQVGAGPSEFTLELTPQSAQLASREYRELYASYRTLSDQALEQEPIPAAQQAIIRTYFESIRPKE